MAQQMGPLGLGLDRSLKKATQATEFHCSGSGPLAFLQTVVAYN